MRIRMEKSFGPYLKGQVVQLPKLEAELLLKAGVAVITKDMVDTDMRTK